MINRLFHFWYGGLALCTVSTVFGAPIHTVAERHETIFGVQDAIFTILTDESRQQFVIEDNIGKPRLMVDFNTPQDETPWPSLVGPLGNSIQYNTMLSPANIASVIGAYNASIVDLPGWKVDSFAGVTVDKTSVYLNTFSSYVPGETLPRGGGAILCIDKKTGDIRWRRTITSYTGIAGDYSRGAPAIHGGTIYFGTNIMTAQTYYPYEYQELSYRFGGKPAAPRGEPPSLLAIDKYTGALRWKTCIGKQAMQINDPDNWLTLTGSVTVFTKALRHDHPPIPIVAIGTSSAQSFYPWFISVGQDAVGAPITFGDLQDVHMTDRGRILLFNGNSGEQLSETFLLPEPLVAGQGVPASAIALNEQYSLVMHHVMPEDLMGGGLLNSPDSNPLTNEDVTVVWILTAGLPVPECLLDYNPLVLRQDTAIVSPINNIISSPIQPVPPFLHRTVIRIDGVRFSPADGVFTLPSSTQQYSIAANIRHHGDLNIQYGTNIWKKMKVGDIMSPSDAYQLSYYGASTWGSAPTVYRDENGEPLLLFVGSGQLHHSPIDDDRVIHAQPGTKPFVERMEELRDASTTSLTAFNQQREIEMQYIEQERLARAGLVSERGKAVWFDSIACFDLSPTNFGKLIPELSLRTLGRDTWNIGHSFDVWGQVTYGAGYFPQTGFSSLSNWAGHARGSDGDFISGVIVVPSATNPGEKIIAGASKYGLIAGFHMTQNLQRVVHSSFYHLVGVPGIDGGSQFGVCSDGTRLFSTQRNAQTLGRKRGIVANEASVPMPYVRSVQNFAPLMVWRSQEDEIIPHMTSFLTAFDLTTQEIAWEAMGPSNLVFSGAPTCTADMVILQESDGQVRIRSSETGQLLHSFTSMDSYGNPVVGNSQIAIDEDSLYVLSARFSANGGNNKPTDQLMCMRLPASGGNGHGEGGGGQGNPSNNNIRKEFTKFPNLYCIPTAVTGTHSNVNVNQCKQMCSRTAECTRYMYGEEQCVLYGGTDCSSLDYAQCYDREGWTVYESCEDSIDLSPQSYVAVPDTGCILADYIFKVGLTIEQCQSVCDHAPTCTRFVWETHLSLGSEKACVLSYTPECNLPDPDVCYGVSGYTLYESCPNRI